MSLHQSPKNGVLTGDSRPRIVIDSKGLQAGQTAQSRPRLDGEGGEDVLGQYLQRQARVQCALDPETLPGTVGRRFGGAWFMGLIGSQAGDRDGVAAATAQCVGRESEFSQRCEWMRGGQWYQRRCGG